MSDFTTVWVKKETAEKIKRLSETDRRKQYDLVDLAVEMYERALKGEILPAQTTTAPAVQS